MPKNPGEEMLDRARLELKRGELEAARRLSVEVYDGPYNLKAEADNVLHSIDAEEFSQKMLTASRSLEAGVDAYVRKDYSQALSILKSTDALMLPPDQQAQLKDMLAKPELVALVAPPAPVPQPAPNPVVASMPNPTSPAPNPILASMPNPTSPAPMPVPDPPVAPNAGQMTSPVAPPPLAPAPVAPPPLAPAPVVPAQPAIAAAPDQTAPPQAANPEASYLKQVEAMQEVQFQELRTKGMEAQRKATDRARSGDLAQALEILQMYLTTLKESQLEPERMALLERPVESRLQGFKRLKAQQDFEKERAGHGESFNTAMQREAQLEEHKKEQVAELMKKYHTFYGEGKYAEAEMVATQAHDLDPDNVEAGAAIHIAHMHRNVSDYQKLKKQKEDLVLGGLNDTDNQGPYADIKEPMKFDKDSLLRAQGRKPFPKEGWRITIETEKQREIEHKLSMPISLDFKDQTLRHVLEDLRDMTGINIVPDMPALEAENINLDRPITMHLEGISTKAALNLILHQAHLIYVIKEEVLLITTEAFAKGKLVTRTYQVADLVIPVENAETTSQIQRILEASMTRPGSPMLSNSTPFIPGHGLSEGTAVGSASGSAGSTPANATSTSETKQGPVRTIEDQLIKLITSSIMPTTWSDMGGPGTIEYYPLGMALVINQTPDIQEQVAELLQALRRLQDMEITVEVRFITLDEAFYERIGLDFQLNYVTNNGTSPNGAAIISQSFTPAGFNNFFAPQHFITGLLPGGSSVPGAYTTDLNIPLVNSSFGPAIPPFGGFPNTLTQDGGLSLGLAFLSDIQVFMFMEAAQANRRTNVMQAPKLTLFNGQTSRINIGTFQYFVTNLNVFQVNGQVIFAPANTAFPLSLEMTLQAVVSADRRYVRLNINQSLTNLASPTTALFPITTFITPVFENGVQGQPVPFTAYLQQPNMTNVAVQTTVNVPDGGTVVLGGLKTLREGRNEFGPPILSKVPYINRLFKNVGYGREAESLLLMVTPRIIIQEEEETRATGVGTGLGLGGGAAPAEVAPAPAPAPIGPGTR
jgi:type II secretory pathway component GspD/PulD (secretin)